MSGRALRWAGLLVGLVALAFVLVTATLIDRRPPSVASITLSRTAGDPSVALTHAAIDVSFSEGVVQGSAERRFRITPSVDGSFSWADERTLVFTPARQLPTATEFTVVVDAGYRDGAGNPATEPSQPFVFRTVGLPAVVASSPAAGTAEVPLDSPISLQFDRLMDTELTAAALRVEPSATLRTTWNGTTLIATPETPLAPNTSYTVRLDPTAADTDGNTLGTPFELAFTTIATGLGVAEVLPRDGSAGAPLDGPIAIAFDAPIDPASVAGSITLTPSAGGAFRAAAVPSDDPGASDAETIAVFDPDGLAPHTTYTVTLAPGAVRSEDGADVAEGRTWRFTTGAPPGGLQNQILFLSARGGVRNVWAMNPDGTNTRAVTAELAPVAAYEASADGRTLVYSVAGIVRRLSLPSGGVTTLTDPTAAEYNPRLTPDGTAVVVWRRTRSPDVDQGLWLVPLVGDDPPRQLLAEGAPALGSAATRPAVPQRGPGDAGWMAPVTFSGDGTTALVVATDGTASVLTLATRVVMRTGIAEVAGPAAWSPRDRRFVVAGTQGGVRGLWLAGGPEPVEARTEAGSWPASAPDGGLVAVTDDGTLDYVPRSGERRPITSSDELEDRQPRFGPGGDAVVFVRVARDDPERLAGIWVVRADGLELRQLSADGTDPRWLP